METIEKSALAVDEIKEVLSRLRAFQAFGDADGTANTIVKPKNLSNGQTVVVTKDGYAEAWTRFQVPGASGGVCIRSVPHELAIAWGELWANGKVVSSVEFRLDERSSDNKFWFATYTGRTVMGIPF